MTILVVDDSQDARELAQAALLSAGYRDVVTAESAWQAIKVLDLGRTNAETPSIELVLLDIVMPEMDGIEACARIRKDDNYSDIPIIMVTSLDDMDNLQNAFVAGANDYVTKPINRVELVARVRAALKLKTELERRLDRERELLRFLSSWGERRATQWIDAVTGLFTAEVIEAYLTAGNSHQKDETVSILALALDRFDAFRSAHGEEASNQILAQVAQAVRGLAATVGIIAGAYRESMIIFVAPEIDATAAKQLGDKLCQTVATLNVPNSESIVPDHVTASVAVVTGQVRRATQRVHLLTHAVSAVQELAAYGGNRVKAVTV
jgi:PleD family two-component response regulator